MGGFYTNYTLKGPSQAEVAEALAGRKAMVSPRIQGCVIAYDEASDEQDMEAICELAQDLSQRLQCPVLAVIDHDDDILFYFLYENGDFADEYDSTPGYFDPKAKPSEPKGGDAQRLCGALGSVSVEAVEAILRRSSFAKDGYVFAHERHAALVRALGLPEISVLKAFASFERGEYPEGLTAEDMMLAPETRKLRPEEKQNVSGIDLSSAREVSIEELERETQNSGCFYFMGSDGGFQYFGTPDGKLFRLHANAMSLPPGRGWKVGAAKMFVTIQDGKIVMSIWREEVR